MQVENINYIIDASCILSYLLPDEITEPLVKKIFIQYQEGEITLLAPYLLPFEVINSIHMAVIRKRLLSAVAPELVNTFLAYAIPLEHIDFAKAFSLAAQENLTVYDASYVALAKEKHIPLLTLDTKLQKLAEK